MQVCPILSIFFTACETYDPQRACPTWHRETGGVHSKENTDPLQSQDKETDNQTLSPTSIQNHL